VKHLNKDIFFNKMEELINIYPSWNIDFSDEEVVRDWYKRFKNIDENTFVEAVNDYIENERFNPTVAGLMEYINGEHDEIEMTIVN